MSKKSEIDGRKKVRFPLYCRTRVSVVNNSLLFSILLESRGPTDIDSPRSVLLSGAINKGRSRGGCKGKTVSDYPPVPLPRGHGTLGSPTRQT